MKKRRLRYLVGGVVALGVLFSKLPDAAADTYDTNSGLTTVSIPLSDSGLPAIDLEFNPALISSAEKSDPVCAKQIQGQSGVLFQDAAVQDKQDCDLDLSLLDPDPTQDIWKPLPTDPTALSQSLAAAEATDAALSVKVGDEVQLLGEIGSSEGHFRFNVNTPTHQTVTVMIAPNLHTYLLRKELLRRLGYQIPGIKYISKLNIRFPDAATRDKFLKIDIPNAVLDATTHWCEVSQTQYDTLKSGLTGDQVAPCMVDPAITSADDLSLTFQDVAVMDATPYYYNVALDPPVQQIGQTSQTYAEGPRVSRVLSLVYGLVNVPESINQVDSYVATIRDGAVTFTIPGDADYTCTVDDALWIVRKIASLTRSDFTQIVANSVFPAQVGSVLVEKLIERRNSLLATFSAANLGRDPLISGPQTISANLKLNFPPAVKDGKVIQESWPGYASRFSWGDPPSPLQGLKWYLVSQVESNAMSNLITAANAQIPSLNSADAIANHEDDLFEQAMQKYLATGAISTLKFGAWVAPIASGSVDISRNIVLGDYLGTTTAFGSTAPLVQLADTFSFNGNVGMIVGFDAIPAFAQIQGQVEGSATLSLTHLKPLATLKSGVTEPLQNEFVPWLYEHAGAILKLASNEPKATSSSTPVQSVDDQNALTNELTQLTKFLGPGESLILTESLSGDESITGAIQAPIPASPTLSTELSTSQLIISRLRIYRSSINPDMIQIFKDQGDLYGLELSIDVGLGTNAAQFPLLTLNFQPDKGKATSRVFNVNIDSDAQTNPNVYAVSNALAQALRTGSLEILESLEKPTELDASFHDNQTTFNFLHYVHRNLKGNGTVEIKLPDGTTDNYLSLNDGVQSGSNYQNLAQEAATFVVQQLTKNGQYGINTQPATDPGQTFLGHSQTREVNLEAKLSPGVQTPYVGIQYRWEGWNITQADTVKLVNTLSSKYGFTLFPDNFLSDTTQIKLYELTLSLSFYQSALNQVATISMVNLKTLENEYNELHHCDKYPDDSQNMASGDVSICSELFNFEASLNTYKKQANNPTKQAQALMEAMSHLEKFATFTDLVSTVGGSKNMYVSAELTGYREGSEVLSNPLLSNTFGTVDPNNPTGVLDSAQNILGIDSGEFDMEWIRSFL